MDRRELEDRFLLPGAELKTFVVEAHVESTATNLHDVFGATAEVSKTDEAFLWRVFSDRAELWIDALDPRFWSVHTWSPSDDARRFLKERIERRRDLDFMWIPSTHLERIRSAQFDSFGSRFRANVLIANRGMESMRIAASGRDSEELIEYIRGNPKFSGALAVHEIGFNERDDELGCTREVVNREGRFRAKGDSFALHQAVVARAVEGYRAFVDLIEQRAIRVTGIDEGGWRYGGAPILLRFSQPVTDLDRLLAILFSSSEPYRLWGVPREVSDGLFHVEAVDLHVGRRVPMDVTDRWLRFHLDENGCGNSVTRLITNLQHTVDADVRLIDPQLQSALAEPRDVSAFAMRKRD